MDKNMLPWYTTEQYSALTKKLHEEKQKAENCNQHEQEMQQMKSKTKERKQKEGKERPQFLKTLEERQTQMVGKAEKGQPWLTTQEENSDRSLMWKAKKEEKTQQKIVLLACLICIIKVPLCATENIGESITVQLVTKPIQFYHDVDLVCTIQTKETPGHWAWIKIPNGENIAVNDKPLNNSKYHVDLKYESSAMKYTLRIKKFAQSDVNCLYRCDSGFLSQYENLQLNKIDFIALPKENDIERKISISDGFLLGNIQVNNVYPELYNCTAIFESEDITSHLRVVNSNTTIDTIFYNMVIEISHSTVQCKGMINVTCSIGSKRIQLMTKDLDECLEQRHDTWILVFLLIIVPTVCIVILGCIVWRTRQQRRNRHHYNCNERGKQNASHPSPDNEELLNSPNTGHDKE